MKFNTFLNSLKDTRSICYMETFPICADESSPQFVSHRLLTETVNKENTQQINC